LHDDHNAAIMPMPRHHASHRDCRRLLIQIAALHFGEFCARWAGVMVVLGVVDEVLPGEQAALGPA
jgi:hypothetical protein